MFKVRTTQNKAKFRTPLKPQNGAKDHRRQRRENTTMKEQ